MINEYLERLSDRLADNPTWFLQTVNIFLATVSTISVLVFIDILYRNRAAWREPFYSAAVGICMVLTGEAIRHWWLWGWRFLGGQGRDWMRWPQVSVFMFSLLIVLVGIVCLLRVFSYERYGHWPWLVAVLVSASVATFFSF